jgi:hypothetical protein
LNIKGLVGVGASVARAFKHHWQGFLWERDRIVSMREKDFACL